MQNVLVLGRLLFFAWLLAFPQLLGVLLYFRLRRLPAWAARILSAIAPALTFILVAPVFLFAGIREAQAHGPACGMPALGALMMLFAGTIFELIVGVSIQILVRTSDRKNSLRHHQ